MAQRCAGCSIAPIFLRLVLGVTFIFAGLGKVTQMMEVSGQPAATLANMDVRAVQAAADGAASDPEAADPRDSRPLPADSAPARPEPTPPRPDPANPPPAPGTTAPLDTPDAPATDPGATDPTTDPAEEPGEDPTTSPRAAALPLLMALQSESTDPAAPGVPAVITASERVYLPSDFREPVEVRSLYGIALLLHKSANPAPREDGSTPTPIVPPEMNDDWFAYLAWTAAISELVGGVLILVGFFGRFAAFILAGTMLAAIWLTQVGPAIQAGTTILGFIPAFDGGAYAKNAAGDYQYAKLLWQCSLLAASAAVLFMGPGALSLDRLLFPGRDRGPRDAD